MNRWLKVVVAGLTAGVLGAVVGVGLEILGVAPGLARELALGVTIGGGAPAAVLAFGAPRRGV